MIAICPNCGAEWSFDEIEREKCYACGWPESRDPAELPENEDDDLIIDDEIEKES